jgi:electron transport complex protein RnfE
MNVSQRAGASNARIMPLLMLCPLLAVSDSVINALGLGAVALLISIIAALPTSITLQRLPEYGRIAAVVIIVSGVVTSAMLLANAWFYDLYRAIGPYMPLLVANGVLIARYDVVVPRTHIRPMIFAGMRTGFLFAATLVVLSAARELVGRGSLMMGAAGLPGNVAERLETQFFHPDMGFVLAVLPPGAFIAMGLLFAALNWFNSKIVSE